jgi:hypothetical protein
MGQDFLTRIYTDRIWIRSKNNKILLFDPNPTRPDPLTRVQCQFMIHTVAEPVFSGHLRFSAISVILVCFVILLFMFIFFIFTSVQYWSQFVITFIENLRTRPYFFFQIKSLANQLFVSKSDYKFRREFINWFYMYFVYIVC